MTTLAARPGRGGRAARWCALVGLALVGGLLVRLATGRRRELRPGNVLRRLRRTTARRERRLPVGDLRGAHRRPGMLAVLAALPLACAACGGGGSPLARVDAAAVQTLAQPVGFDLTLAGATAFRSSAS